MIRSNAQKSADKRLMQKCVIWQVRINPDTQPERALTLQRLKDSGELITIFYELLDEQL